MPKITLTVAGQEFDLLALHYRLHLDVDLKGRPSTPIRDGLLYMALESTENNFFFEQFVTKELNTKPFAGKIEAMMYWDETVVRRLVWKEAYLIGLSERMDCFSTEPMTMELVISPINLTIDNRVYLTRQQPKTSGFWQIDPEPEMTPMRSPDVLSYAATPEKPKVLVTAVKGKAEAYPNEKVTYTVTSYSSAPTDTDRKRVSWMVQVDGKRESISKKGEEIVLKMKEDWAGKEILVMAYLVEPDENVSQQTKVKLEAVIVFVNGYWNSGESDPKVKETGYAFLKKLIAENIIGSTRLAPYWSGDFVKESEKYFKRKYTEWTTKEIEKTEFIFIDGTSNWNSSGKERWDNGYKEATSLIETELKSKKVINDENEQQKRIFFVSHSMGAAHAEGMICSWAGYPYNWKIDGVLHFSPADNRDFSVKLPSVTWEINILPDPVLTYKNFDDMNKAAWVTVLELLGKQYSNEKPHYYQIKGLRKDHYIYIINHWDYLNHAHTRNRQVWELVDFLKQ